MPLFGRPDVGKLAAKRNLKGLIQALGTRQPPEVTGAALQALIAFGGPAVEPLIGALRHKDPSVRSRAIAALKAIGDPRAAEPLIAVLCDRGAGTGVRYAAATALQAIGGRTGGRPAPLRAR